MKKQNMKKNKIICLLISLFASFVLWSYVVTVINTEQTETIYNIPVTFIGTDILREQNLIITEGADATISLRVTGRRSVVQQLNQDNVIVEVDVSKINRAGEYSRNYNITYPSSLQASNFTEVRRIPSMINITVEDLITKEIPVRVSFQGSAAEGYMLDSATPAYDAITIAGTEEQVQDIESALIIVEDQDLTTGFTRNMEYTLLNASGDPVEAEGIEVEMDTISVTVNIVKYKEVPLIVNFTPGGGATETNVTWEADPPSIIVSGDENILDSLNQIVLGEENLSGIVADAVKTYPIVLPEGVKNETGEIEATVTISFTGLSSTTVRATNFQFTNVPSNFVASAVTQSLQITIRGPSDEIQSIEPADLTVVADLSDISGVAGTYTINSVSVNIAGNTSCGVLGNYSVMVTLVSEQDYLASMAENDTGEGT